jgi:hypothetical protein
MHSSGISQVTYISVFSKDEGCDNVPIGLYIMRGDSVSVVCGIDEERDKEVDWGTVRQGKGQAIKAFGQ